MGKQHELLAVEKTRANALAGMIADTNMKFNKVDQYFVGAERTLKMLEDNPGNKALEDAARQVRNLTTTVPETLEYLLGYWASNEDVLFQKNKTNQIANADLEFRGQVILRSVPVEELLGLETRLDGLRKVMVQMPTLPSAKKWEPDLNAGMTGVWKGVNADQTTKTEKVMVPIILAPATDKHPAQVKESTSDKVVGLFTDQYWSGAATSKQKAEVLAVIDDLISEVKKARMRANNTEACSDVIGSVLTALIMEPFKQ